MNYRCGGTSLDHFLIICYLYMFVIGCCVASFINVVIYRVPRELSIAKGRSFCPSCGKQLHWNELIPVISYVWLRGKCRDCNSKIPLRDVLLEISGGCIGLFCFYQYQFTLNTVFAFVLFMILLAITWIDFDTMTIPNGLVLSLAILCVGVTIVHPEVSIGNRIIGLCCISVPMYGLTLWIEDCFGGGDIKLIGVAGWLLGWQNTLLAGFIAIMIAGCYAIYLLLRKRAGKGAHIAFGPYLCIGISVAYVYGSTIITAYLSLFHLA